MVITTKLGVSASSHMLRGGRWHQLVVTCVVFTSSAKPRGHSPAHIGSKGFEPRPMLWRLKRFTSWASAAWRLSEHAERIYILIQCLYVIYFIFIWVNFNWKKELRLLGKLQNDVFFARKYLSYWNNDYFRVSIIWCSYFHFIRICRIGEFLLRVKLKNFI